LVATGSLRMEYRFRLAMDLSTRLSAGDVRGKKTVQRGVNRLSRLQRQTLKFDYNNCPMKFHASLVALAALASVTAQAQPYVGNGIKIGEVSADSAIVWMRLTERAAPNWDGQKWRGTTDRDFDVGKLGEKQFAKGASLAEMEGSLLGLDGMVRLSWWPEDHPKAKQQTEWLTVDPQRDFTRQIALEGLSSKQNYALKIESRSIDGQQGQSLSGSFRTAPGPSTSEPTRFVVSTCQSWKTRDKGTAGLQIYDHMLDLDPAFFVHLGDIVYYDKRSAGGAELMKWLRGESN
jgi:alkaline phosphatase D